MSRADATYSNELYDSAVYVDTDQKFRRFIYGNIFANGLHAWWLIGVCGLLTVIAIAFAFLAAIVDSDLLRNPHVYVDRSDVTSNAQLKQYDAFDELLSVENLKKVALLELSRRELTAA